VRGSGTVVTGTLPSGRIRVGDELVVAGSGRVVRVRALQSLGQPVDEATGVARVAVNLRGVDRTDLARGDALVTPDAWTATSVLDVRLHGRDAGELPEQLVLHVGSAAIACRLRPLGRSAARLTLPVTVPLHVGDRALVRDPARAYGLTGVTALDVSPPRLRRRGAAAARAATLEQTDANPTWTAELRRRGLVSVAQLRRMGVPYDGPANGPTDAGWLIDEAVRRRLERALADAVEAWRRDHPLESGLPIEAARATLRLPDRALVDGLVTPPYAVRAGRVVRADTVDRLPDGVRAAVAQVVADLEAAPFVAPDAHRLAALGLGRREVAAAVRAGQLLDLGDGVVLCAGADDTAVAVLRAAGAPFTPSEAKQLLGTTRRVVVPLLEHLDRRRLTRKLADGRRTTA
jgi:selenocysteine-specific elongation factor